MHVAIDAHMVGERETGNETYVLNLVKALLRDSRGLADYSLLTSHPDRLQTALPGLPSGTSIVPLRPGNALLRIPLVLPWTAARRQVDLLHVTYNAPPVSLCPTVVTVHDISFERYPEFFSPRDLAILRALVPWSVRRARRVITVSQHARNEIADRYGIRREKIAVTYEAAADSFRPVEDEEGLRAVRHKYAIGDGPFVLALGNLQPRKNMRRLVEAFAGAMTYQSGSPSPPLPLPYSHSPILVIAGKAQWRESEVVRAVAEAGLEDQVVFPGYVDEDDLPALYSAATVFVYPSLYEGFGLPPLEAMACGTPVISSNAASLPEVVGNAARMVDPTDSEDLSQALVDVLTNPGLRADLRVRGLHRASQFSWERCAAETLAVYGQAVAAKG